MVYAACFRNEGIVVSLCPNMHGCQRDGVAASALSDDKEIILYNQLRGYYTTHEYDSERSECFSVSIRVNASQAGKRC